MADLVSPDEREKMVSLDDLELPVFLELREMLVTQEPLVCLEAREKWDEVEVMVLLETGESLETLVPPERVDSGEIRESLDYLETWEHPEREVIMELELISISNIIN